ncbi:YALI0D22484p [Yarrowia lipolytica CLIB122]|uniref:Serine hydroxymethyltransferase n=2 Tax=Yarrowia lipolytica TaxID=4952 RepID=Q6C859_YARLI|nr:YALI0D22484p [Yarrowia lipolytica CLIB122]AOW04466.1 hypothetical protein YALI1_D28569g [Yarrowia lipolytica]KAB8285722.1 serine hydroxymethyltransferase [Yarrowia lipolytica]KAE8172382.1 serine hydroxymethyltransferase [Yarrowia lipolytica]KAJ8054064.1 serine hydroxymethyltransferase [Yarrowia lipolytica]RMI99356.1 serine hydroxymethyltransferase [Yarrowia lipolytica]|eukprot:XP_503153.1 YALI0D22484p [Yarrowia lipolytica CLIB122]
MQRFTRLSRPLNRGLLRAYATKASPDTQMTQQTLYASDPEIADIIKKETDRQIGSITLIPSENFTSQAVMNALGSVMQNKYSEGYPGARYYGGNEFIDQAESLCQKRALEAFNLDPKVWGVNVQPLSGAPANLYAYSAVMEAGDRLMGLDLPHGGHLSHGYQIPSKKISYISKYFNTMPYRLDESTGLIDYDTLAKNILLFRPKVLVAGASAYSRLIDYKRMREIADSVGAILMSDMAHISGMVAAGVIPSPFEYSDIVTTTTHKSLRGPRGAMIFYRKDGDRNLEEKINFSVFPGHQGGPHNHTITALAVALGQAKSPEFKEYQQKVVDNAQAFSKALSDAGFKLVSDGTDTHLILIDLKPFSIDGARTEMVLDGMNIAANKNTVPGDKSALVPGGIRIGTPAMTTRGFDQSEFEQVAKYIVKAVDIAKRLKQKAVSEGVKKISQFRPYVDADAEVKELRNEVESWAKKYPFPIDPAGYK